MDDRREILKRYLHPKLCFVGLIVVRVFMFRTGQVSVTLYWNKCFPHCGPRVCTIRSPQWLRVLPLRVTTQEENSIILQDISRLCVCQTTRRHIAEDGNLVTMFRTSNLKQ
jgi:hypothetical protein